MIPAPKKGDPLMYREFNLRSHFGADAECVSIQGDTITVKHRRSGRVGDWLLRDWLPYKHTGTNDYFQGSKPQRPIENLIFGLTEDQIAAKQGISKLK